MESRNFSNFTLILAFQRSGTTALRNILENSGKFYNFGEIFAPIRTKQEHGVYNFFEKSVKSDLTHIYPSFENRVRFFDLYFESLQEKAESTGKFPLIDVKYDVLYNMHTYFQGVDIEPFFLKFCKMRKVKIVHLVRDNSFEIALSLAIARKNKQYHFKEHQAQASDITLEKEDVARFFKDHINQVSMAENYLKNHSHLALTYEKSFENSRLTKNSIQSLSNYLNLDLNKAESNFVKKSKSNKDLISNLKEVSDYVADIQKELVKRK